MITADDLRAAVGAGYVTEAQAAAVTQLAHSRHGARSGLSGHDEPFEVFRGFNEIFIVVGLIILASGWYGLVGITFVSQAAELRSWATTYGVIGAGVLWLLSEYFIRNRRMIAPSIALSLFFAVNAAVAFVVAMSHPFMIAQRDYSSLPLPMLLATLSLCVFWLRFRVPFSMALIALGAFSVTILLAAIQSGTPQHPSDLFLLSADGPFAWITLAIGVAVFALAMAFDMSDPHRVTRRSANGFWLHLVAAPALVNTVALSLLEHQGVASTLALSALLAVFAIIAIVIDRRSFLIAAIGYVVSLMATLFDSNNAATGVLTLGLVLLMLGAFWERIRARLLTLVPGFIPLNKLPPSIHQGQI